ncbi:unnamed protein product [Rhizophagus irregularis]|uniref:Uncharacterized protein n=1 Tax=Rhizophagus irregularis TaxID=588596 RepID=A0A2I1GHY6_9GLOM|nr:hypothetical protein RhiirA4_416108 [Rhizophagus irregularis]PKY46239.1 hypothetical protein RhiirA4_461059 [Rhizophagus irregularis]CAB4422262.1 unnamed protein product [Rhizophagus irregularis]CAB4422532.1 unnamed protein product [Rhizophagus irregularis]
METKINFENNNNESEFREVLTGSFPDNFDDFEEFTDFANGSDLETFQETIEKGHKIDDFDDFADFTESSDSFEKLGNFQENNLNNNFGIQLSNVSSETKLPQVDIENLSSVLDKVFRSNDDISSTNIKEIYSDDDTGLEAILNTPGSLEIWRQISYETTENPFQWKRSKIRREFYASLGIDVAEEIKVPVNTNTMISIPSMLSPQPLRPASKSATCSSSAPVSRSTTPSSNNNLSSSSYGNLSKTNNTSSHSEIPKQIDVELAKSLCSISEETLQEYTTTQLFTLKSQILSLSRQTSDILTYWLDQREQTMMDSETYNRMIERLVGHAQKLRDGGSSQSKSWENRGKKKNSVASGLASISLSFKNKKAQLSSPISPKSASSEVSINNKTTIRNNIGMQERPLSM